MEIQGSVHPRDGVARLPVIESNYELGQGMHGCYKKVIASRLVANVDVPLQFCTDYKYKIPPKTKFSNGHKKFTFDIEGKEVKFDGYCLRPLINEADQSLYTVDMSDR